MKNIDKELPKNRQSPAGQAWMQELAGAQPQGGGAMQQMLPVLNQLLGHHGGKSTRLNQDGTIKDMNAPSGLDWLEAHGPNRASVQARAQQLTQELGGTTAQKGAQGRQSVQDQLQWSHDTGPRATMPQVIQQEFVGPTQPAPGAQTQHAQVQNPDALLPWLNSLWDTNITGTKAKAPASPQATAQPRPGRAVANPDADGLSWLTQLGSQLGQSVEPIVNGAAEIGKSAFDWLTQFPQQFSHARQTGLSQTDSDFPSWMLDLAGDAGQLAQGAVHESLPVPAGMKPEPINVRNALPQGTSNYIPTSWETPIGDAANWVLQKFGFPDPGMTQRVKGLNRGGVSGMLGLPWLTPEQGQKIIKTFDDTTTYKFPF